MKKVLVIGAHSNIGKKFKTYIDNCYVQNISVDLVSASDGDWRKVDMSKYDTVLHLAALVHKKEKKDMQEDYKKVNYELAVNVAKKAKESKVKQFIFMSTAAVYGNYLGCITKETIPKPTTYYGKSKLNAEKDILKLECDDFLITIIRAPMVYGEGCKGNYEKLIKLAKVIPVFPKYHNKRSYLSIERLNKYLAYTIINEFYGYLYPQDDDYLDIVNEFTKLRGKKTVLISIFNPIIKFLLHRVKYLSKIFGDLYYSKELTENIKLKEMY